MEMSKQFVTALSAEEAVKLIGTDLAAFADGGPNRREEDIELGRTAGLDIEMISARWDKAERAAQKVDLKPIEVVVEPPSTQAHLDAEQGFLHTQGWGDEEARPAVSKAAKR